MSFRQALLQSYVSDRRSGLTLLLCGALVGLPMTFLPTTVVHSATIQADAFQEGG